MEEEILQRVQNIELTCLKIERILEAFLSKRNSEELCAKIEEIKSLLNP